MAGRLENKLKANGRKRSGSTEHVTEAQEYIEKHYKEKFSLNRIAGSLAVKLGVEDGFKPANTILDLCYNNDELGDPLINRDQAAALSLASYLELDVMYDIVRRSGKLLTDLFHKAGIELVDAKFEFGRAADTGAIIISDEISPDTCRLWDEETGERLDKDRFRLDLGDVSASYAVVLERLKQVIESE